VSFPLKAIYNRDTREIDKQILNIIDEVDEAEEEREAAEQGGEEPAAQEVVAPQGGGNPEPAEPSEEQKRL
jgi:hypothetical protein